MPELGFAVIVKFKENVRPPYDARMINVINYLRREVLDCQAKAG
jgi:hypothetical protein